MTPPATVPGKSDVTGSRWQYFRRLKWALWVMLMGGIFLYLHTSPPFMAVASNSMSPTFSRGDVIFIKRTPPEQIKGGSIIVFNVPDALQQRYSYPATISHRVVRFNQSGTGLSFRTKGDNNSSEDPFVVLPEEVIGEESGSVQYLGYLLMFPLSKQGWYFLTGMGILYFLYANSDRLVRGTTRIRSSVFGVSSAEFSNYQHDLTGRMDTMTTQVEQSLNQFSAAMNEYAKHLASHTSAVKSLAEAAEHLDKAVAHRNDLFETKEEMASAQSYESIMESATKTFAELDYERPYIEGLKSSKPDSESLAAMPKAREIRKRSLQPGRP